MTPKRIAIFVSLGAVLVLSFFVTPAQMTIFAILAVTLALFMWDRWRFDIVALAALFACVLTGLVEPGRAFEGFSHPAVITIIAVLAISRALSNSGLIDMLASRLVQVAQNQFIQFAVLCGIAILFSAFMNNVGALALLMPVAIATARKFDYSPSHLLMPLAFASILGGFITLIGTPPNIIIAHFRAEVGENAFRMFDFTPVGLGLALAGGLFVVLVSRQLVPRHRRGQPHPQELFEISDYITEVRITEQSPIIGQPVGEFENSGEGRLRVLGMIRENRRLVGRIQLERLQAGDILLIEGSSDTFKDMMDQFGLELLPSEELQESFGNKDLTVIEAVVTPQARIVGRTPTDLHLRSYYGINILAVARQGKPSEQRLRDVQLKAGDVLLLQGEAENLSMMASSLGCLPLASRDLKFQPRRILLPIVIFGTGIAATVMGLLPAAVALLGAALVMILVGLLTVNEAYDSIDWPVVVLIGAMIPVGTALKTTGATGLIATAITGITGNVSPFISLGLVIMLAMALSAVMNNAATAVVMAPIAISVAQHIGVDPDPFLMAAAVGASAAFITPIGHQNNTLVMGPGGYQFSDYWRLGLPLQILLLVMGVWLIPVVWPFQ